MTFELRLLLAVVTSFILSMVLAPPVIKMTKKFKASQSILEYVDNHKGKEGTPTMGGMIFLVSMSVTSFIFCGFKSKFLLVGIGITLGYGLLGFLDDFLKIKFRHNEGLKAYQKIIGQLGIAVIVTVFAYKYSYIGSVVNIPFTDIEFDMGWWYIPFTLLIFIATTNAVNLTDGIDGLAGSVTGIYTGIFTLIAVVLCIRLEGDVILRDETASLGVMSASLFGALLGFLWFNSNPAKIFMGDTGSLALGGAVSVLAVFTKNPFLIPMIGIMYMLSCISVIIQVLYFKLTNGKRVFKMAPYHHHLQYKGYTENKIVTFYSIVTLLFGLTALVSTVIGR